MGERGTCLKFSFVLSRVQIPKGLGVLYEYRIVILYDLYYFCFLLSATATDNGCC